jgi:putative phosphoribosyl transferase
VQFVDRVEAGNHLAHELIKYRGLAVVYALPRGGVVLGSIVAHALGSPLDLILVKKIGHPNYPEYAISALAEDDQPVGTETDHKLENQAWFRQTVFDAQQENERRRQSYFPQGYTAPNVTHQIAIIIDDGMATGLTMLAAVRGLRQHYPQKIVIAVPVAPSDSVAKLKEQTDEVIVVDQPDHFLGAVGAHYVRFPQVEDYQVIELLQASANN